MLASFNKVACFEPATLLEKDSIKKICFEECSETSETDF